jgi:hypothetical protein
MKISLSKGMTVTKQMEVFGGCENFTVRRKNCSMAKWHKMKKINLLPEKLGQIKII